MAVLVVLMLVIGVIAGTTTAAATGAGSTLGGDAAGARRSGSIDGSASVRLPNYITEGVVFQRDKNIVFSGWGVPKAELTITLGKSTSTVTCGDNGKFTVRLAAPEARLKPYILTISQGDTTALTISKVYVGDVFIASGQSNMEASYHDYYSTDSLVASNLGNHGLDSLPPLIDDEHVHFLVLNRSNDVDSEGDAPLRDFNATKWLSASGNNSEYLGYLPQFFAENIRDKEPNIPIGIIQTAWGGTQITQHMKGGDIYNSHIKPFSGFNVAGVLWYQGESDAESDYNSINYVTRFSRLINQYRTVFNDEKLPFLYAQLARYKGLAGLMLIRQSQLEVASSAADSNIAMTVTTDTDKGSSDLLHPLGKDIVAYRMAQQWAAMQSNKDVPVGAIPVRANSLANGAIRITFKSGTAEDLTAMNPIFDASASPTEFARLSGSDELSGFEVGNAKGQFTTVPAYIQGNTIVVDVAEKSVTQVRYQWTGAPAIGPFVYNKNMLPLSPFTLTVE